MALLRANLATRPFYNERLVSAALGLVALGVLALTAFNVSELAALTSARSELRGRVARDEKLAADIRTGAMAAQQQVDRSTMLVLASATREANLLIDQRTFSWTVLFGLIERTLPYDVRLVAVAPRIEREAVKIVMIVVARRSDDLLDFIEALQGTGAFYDVLPREQQRNDDGTYNATVEAFYLPPAPPAAGAGAGRGGAGGRP